MITKRYKSNEKKIDLDKYTGIVSHLFERVFDLIKVPLKKIGFVVTEESWFVISLIIFAVINYKFPNKFFWVICPLIGILLLNLAIPNFSLIRKKFFKTSQEKFNDILKNSETEDILSELESFLKNQNLSIDDLKKIFSNKKLADTYEIYEIIFSLQKPISEGELNFFFDKKLLDKEFIDEKLIDLLIKNASETISHTSFKRLLVELKNKKVTPKILSYFNYKYYRHITESSSLKNIRFYSEKVYDFIFFIATGSMVLLFFIYLILNDVSIKQNLQTSSLLDIIVCVFLTILAVFIINVITHIILKKILIKKLS